MNTRRLMVAITVVVSVSTAAFAGPSTQHADFGKGPAQFLMTAEEQAKWKSIATDADAEAFETLFWARRDPTPGTPRNEFRENFDAAVKYADEHFGQKRQRGALTDRGRVLVLFGAPAKATLLRPKAAPIGSATESTNDREPMPGPTITWIYEGKSAQPGGPVQIAFVDRFNTGDFAISRGFDSAAAQRAINAAITQPNLTSAALAAQAAAPAQRPVASAPAVAPKAPVAPQPVVAATSFKTASLQEAVDAFKAGGKPAKNAWVSWGEYVTASGNYFVPMQLAVSGVPGLSAGQEVTLFGEVQDENGKTIQTFEEPVKLTDSHGDLVADHSLSLPAGKGRAFLGFAAAGKVLALASTDVTLAGSIDKDAVAVSQLILSDNIFPLSAAQKPDDPFAFGGIKVIPKGDRTFARSDELWYFFELRNPGLDPATNAPKVQVKLELVGKGPDGKPVTRTSPPREVDPQPLKGVPGQFGVGSSMPLESFKPGEYTLKVKVNDTVRKAIYNLQETFKIVEPK